MTNLTKAQERALVFLADHNGEGCIDRHGRLVCGGEVAPFDNSTWLRLVAHQYMKGQGANRLELTGGGWGAVNDICDAKEASGGRKDWHCVKGHDRCDQMHAGPECPYCEQW